MALNAPHLPPTPLRPRHKGDKDAEGIKKEIPSRIFVRAVLILAFPGLLPTSTPALESEVLRCMVIVEGDEGRGSGFLVRMGETVYVVTNAHVVQGSETIVFKTLDNRELKIGPLEIADSADLVRAEVSDATTVIAMPVRIEERLKIGDEVVVAGNAEGEGVVREIPGKVVGIGPDRVEVDAGFVPGNSGSPILLKTTGEVIGVATYLKIPPFHGFSGDSDKAPKPATRLNEVRRFGYRLDTVGEWIRPSDPGGVLEEARRLAELDALDEAVFSLVRAGTKDLVEHGAAAFITEEQRKLPRFGELGAAVDAFVSTYGGAKDPKAREKPFLTFFARLRELTSLDPPETVTDRYSGYHANRYRERFEWREGLHEWLDFMKRRAEKKDWILEVPEWEWLVDEPVDFSKLNLTFEHHIDWTSERDRRHRVVCPEPSRPASYRNLHWVIELVGKWVTVMPMSRSSLRVSTTSNGLYRVHAEHRIGDEHRKVSSIIEFTVADLPPPNAIVDFQAAPPLSLDPASGDTPDWDTLASRLADGLIAMSPILGNDVMTTTIRDIPAAGGILVGLDLFLVPHGKSRETLAALRPVFLGKDGQKGGSYWGNPQIEGQFRLAANPGYAIGTLSVKYDGDAIRAVKVRFDRMRGLALDSADSYETDWIGEGGEAKEYSVETNGRLPVGIIGKHNNEIDGLRLVCLTDAGTAPPPVEVPPVPEVFSSADEILNHIPLRLIDLAKRPETRKDAVAGINEFLAKHVKGKRFEGEVRVELAMPLADRSPNKFRIKAPDTRIHSIDPIRTRLWVYFLEPDVPAPAPAVGSKVRVSGHIGRCDVNGDKQLLINNDIQGSKMLPPVVTTRPDPDLADGEDD